MASKSKLKKLIKLAEKGCAYSQYNLGTIYSNDLCELPQSDALAVKWYSKAADQGNALAQFNLGILYSNGRCGLPQSLALALEWYHKAADQGVEQAQSNLAFAYQYGMGGLPQSEALAVEWYRKAADQGFSIAQFYLGNLYMTQGNFSDAIRMFNAAKDDVLWTKKSEEKINEIFYLKKKIKLETKGNIYTDEKIKEIFKKKKLEGKRWKCLKEIYIKKNKSKKVTSYKDCAFCGASEGSIPGIVIHKFCSKCKMTYYCSVECQKKHWKGSHKKYCLTPEERRVPIELRKN